MSVTPREVRQIAALARLALADDEVGPMSEQLSSILGHMDALGQVDASDPAAERADAAAPLRADEPGHDPLLRAPAEIAPAWSDPFFVVPRLAALDADAAEGA